MKHTPDPTDMLARLRRLAERSRPWLLRAARAPFALAGTEPTATRDYVPGDDYRQLDWPLCARRDELQTRVFEGVPPGRVDLLIDGSASMALTPPASWRESNQGGSDAAAPDRPTKLDVARHVAAMLGAVVLHGEDAVSATMIAQRAADGLPPIRGKGQLPTLARWLAATGPLDGPTDLRRAAEQFTRRRQRPGVVVLISDLYDPSGFPAAVDVLRRRGYSPRLVQLYAPWELDPGRLGMVELFDVEHHTTRAIRVTGVMAQRYRRRFQRFLDTVQQYCAAHATPYVRVATDMTNAQLERQILGEPVRRLPSLGGLSRPRLP